MDALTTMPWKIEQDLQMEARKLTRNGITEYLQKLNATYPSTFIPAKIVQEVLHNPELPLTDLLPSHVSPQFYKSILHHLETALAPIDATGSTREVRDILTILVTDTQFSAMDDGLFKIVCRVVGAKSPLADLSEIRRHILNACTPPRFAVLGTAFVEVAYQDVWPEATAQRVLENLLSTHVYPFFDKYRFLFHALEQAGEKSLHYFLLQQMGTYFTSSVAREDILLMLAETAPYDFPIFYFKNQYRITQGLDRKYSPRVKQLHKLCYNRLTFMQKILSAFPILL